MIKPKWFVKDDLITENPVTPNLTHKFSSDIEQMSCDDSKFKEVSWNENNE
jgi:hypothetical protein